jgi:hypothetical protein
MLRLSRQLSLKSPAGNAERRSRLRLPFARGVAYEIVIGHSPSVIGMTQALHGWTDRINASDLT